uniref:Putative secreted protein n=1 Tax=Ixodes ricinus TaxID=34613 RepID=A0A147BIK0_IXORI
MVESAAAFGMSWAVLTHATAGTCLGVLSSTSPSSPAVDSKVSATSVQMMVCVGGDFCAVLRVCPSAKLLRRSEVLGSGLMFRGRGFPLVSVTGAAHRGGECASAGRMFRLGDTRSSSNTESLGVELLRRSLWVRSVCSASSDSTFMPPCTYRTRRGMCLGSLVTMRMASRLSFSSCSTYLGVRT